MANSEAAVRGAQEVGAQNVPQAALQLKLAQEEIEKGRSLMKDGKNDRADYVLQRAQADAELAVALAKENQTRTEAQAAVDQVKTLKSGGAAAPPIPASNNGVNPAITPASSNPAK